MKWLFLISIFFAAASVVVAGSLYVDDNGPDDPEPGNPLVSDPAEDGSQAHPYDAIQQAIDAATNGDEVIILPGTYTGDGNRDIDFKGKPVTIKSKNGPESCIIDCQGTAQDPHRGFVLTSEEGPDSIIEGLTITNGWVPDTFIDAFNKSGGAIACRFTSSPTIRDCIISGNQAGNGGGIYGSAGLIENCIISDNEVSGSGGGMHSCRGKIANCQILRNTAGFSGGGGVACRAVISNCRIISNTALYGGGLASCDTEIEYCDIFNNLAIKDGGGLNLCTGRISNCKISNNTALRNGGGLSTCYGMIQGCQISGNRAGNRGGGIFRRGLPLNLLDCEIIGNVAGVDGGGIFVASLPLGSPMRITYLNCTIADNRAMMSGGGIAHDRVRLELDNCILYGNWAMQGEQVSLQYVPTYPPQYEAGSLGITNTNIQGGVEAVYYDPELPEGMIQDQGNIDIDPLFAAPGLWDPNETPEAMEDDSWVGGDYYLKSQAGRWDVQLKDWVTDEVTSPCIDAGNVDSAIGYEPFPNGGVINMGAYGGTTEASKSYFGAEPCETILAGDINGDCIVNLADMAILSRHWLKDAR